MFGPVFESARIRLFLGFASVRQERLYSPPNFLPGGVLIGALEGGRGRSRLSRRRGDAVFASLACPAIANRRFTKWSRGTP
jgi:hypothetical protein